jgi:hypothetical protein
MPKSAGDLLTAHASRVTRESDVRYVKKSVLRGTPLEPLINCTVAVVNKSGVLHAVVLQRGARRPAAEFEVYEARNGHKVAARTFVAAEISQTFIVPIEKNITATVKT